jgi:hypothetical protein
MNLILYAEGVAQSAARPMYNAFGVTKETVDDETQGALRDPGWVA